MPQNVKRFVGFRSIIFDCDSTLVSIEGIDALAGDRTDEIRALTDAAMAGTIPLDEVYGQRLELIRPAKSAVEALGQAYVGALVPDAGETVAALCWLGKTVRILSGGLLPGVEAVARALGLPNEAVAAVAIQFSPDGAYYDFDRASPLARSGGKAEAIHAWGLPGPTLLVGDGATDLEARPAVDAFAAYTGIVYRPAVAAAADYVLSDPSLSPVLALAADPEDRARLATSPWADLLTRADELLVA